MGLFPFMKTAENVYCGKPGPPVSETQGPLRNTDRTEGWFESSDGDNPGNHFLTRLTFYNGLPVIKVETTILFGDFNESEGQDSNSTQTWSGPWKEIGINLGIMPGPDWQDQVQMDWMDVNGNAGLKNGEAFGTSNGDDMGVVVPYFREMFPKALKKTDTGLVVDIWPDFSKGQPKYLADNLKVGDTWNPENVYKYLMREYPFLEGIGTEDGKGLLQLPNGEIPNFVTNWQVPGVSGYCAAYYNREEKKATCCEKPAELWCVRKNSTVVYESGHGFLSGPIEDEIRQLKIMVDKNKNTLGPKIKEAKDDIDNSTAFIDKMFFLYVFHLLRTQYETNLQTVRDFINSPALGEPDHEQSKKFYNYIVGAGPGNKMIVPQKENAWGTATTMTFYLYYANDQWDADSAKALAKYLSQGPSIAYIDPKYLVSTDVIGHLSVEGRAGTKVEQPMWDEFVAETSRMDPCLYTDVFGSGIGTECRPAWLENEGKLDSNFGAPDDVEDRLNYYGMWNFGGGHSDWDSSHKYGAWSFKRLWAATHHNRVLLPWLYFLRVDTTTNGFFSCRTRKHPSMPCKGKTCTFVTPGARPAISLMCTTCT